MPLFERQLPPELKALHQLAADLHWSWYHGGDALWEALDPEIWRHTRNPVGLLQFTSDQRLATLAKDPDFMALLSAQTQARHQYHQHPGWYRQTHHQTRPQSPLKGMAYFSMEFGLCDALPLYAGGLGILAGDYLKTASDLDLPLVGVGLLYQEGYFRQSLDKDGWQQETYLYNDPGSLPLQPLLGKDGAWLHISTHFLCREVRFRIWQAQVGRVTLYLLDSNDPRNQMADRGITSKLYGGGTELRLVQEIALGICGWRLVETLGLDIDVCHLNEGHAAFATLERIRSCRERLGLSFDEALWATRGGNLFTTHTPVEAGFDRYPVSLIRRYIGEYAAHLGISMEKLIRLGQAQDYNEEEPFNMAYLAMRTCARSNGVSQLHGAVSRGIFQPLFPRWPEREVPVGHVTNGVHVPTWDSPAADQLWTQVYGRERWRQDLALLNPAAFDQVGDGQLWQLTTQGRARLVDFTRERLARQYRHEFTPESCELPGPLPLDPNILTLGFARRFAEYKRPDLLLTDPPRLARLLSHHQQPVQLIIAGKAHPADNQGKRALQRWHHFIQQYQLQRQLVLVEDYDISLAQHLVQGVDLWLNTPRRPWEASGTSGMKVLVNGGLNLSSLDGWWAEAYDPAQGWALGDGEEHGPEDDAQDAEALYRLLEQEIIPCFYQRNEQGLPTQWLARIRASMARLTPEFSSNRMLRDYLTQYYLPAAQSQGERLADKAKLARELAQWEQQLREHWHEIHLGELTEQQNDAGRMIETQVYLGGLEPTLVTIEAVADPSGEHPAEVVKLQLDGALEGAINAHRYYAELNSERPLRDFTLRAVAAHLRVQVPGEMALVVWGERREFTQS